MATQTHHRDTETIDIDGEHGALWDFTEFLHRALRSRLADNDPLAMALDSAEQNDVNDGAPRMEILIAVRDAWRKLDKGKRSALLNGWPADVVDPWPERSDSVFANDIPEPCLVLSDNGERVQASHEYALIVSTRPTHVLIAPGTTKADVLATLRNICRTVDQHWDEIMANENPREFPV
jgi:hypothetical protein